ncbi:MAG TPA: hypothetical protein VN316_02145 [candidate division Zixibacteria bacterium]|nr:hypothetical protein [candidate division Zixibacteria bacterium]
MAGQSPAKQIFAPSTHPVRYDGSSLTEKKPALRMLILDLRP